MIWCSDSCPSSCQPVADPDIFEEGGETTGGLKPPKLRRTGDGGGGGGGGGWGNLKFGMYCSPNYVTIVERHMEMRKTLHSKMSITPSFKPLVTMLLVTKPDITC